MSCYSYLRNRIQNEEEDNASFFVITLTLFILAFIHSELNIMGKCLNSFGGFFLLSVRHALFYGRTLIEDFFFIVLLISLIPVDRM